MSDTPRTPNRTKPGLPGYTGPDQGWALWVHHAEPLEYCTSFASRIAYIVADKPPEEHPLRLAALTALPESAIPHALVTARAAYRTAWAAADTARKAHWAAYETARTTYRTAWATYETARKAHETAYETALAAYETALAAANTALAAANTAGTAYRTALAAANWRVLAATYASNVPHYDGELDFTAWPGGTS